MDDNRHQGADSYGYGNNQGYGNNNGYADYSGSYNGFYDYTQPQGYGSLAVDNSGRTIDLTDNHLLNTYWANMHRQWGHQRETRLNSFGQPHNNLVVSIKKVVNLTTFDIS